MLRLLIMNKTQAVDFLKERGLEISWTTLDRHRKEGRVVAGTVKSRTGEAIDYSEEALLTYLAKELPNPAIALAKPAPAKPSQALAKVPFEALPKGLQVIEIDGEASHPVAKALVEVHQVASRNVWTLDEAVAATGVSKGALKSAIKQKKLRGGLDGGKLKVNAVDARRFAEELF
jgi:hypothetical protein